MHVEMEISGSRLTYVAGDHLAIFPSNDPQLVEQIRELLDVDLNTVFSLTNIDGMLHCCVSVCLYIPSISLQILPRRSIHSPALPLTVLLFSSMWT